MRETIAYGLIAILIFAAIPTLFFVMRRRKRQALRRRGIKRFGH